MLYTPRMHYLAAQDALLNNLNVPPDVVLFQIGYLKNLSTQDPGHVGSIGILPMLSAPVSVAPPLTGGPLQFPFTQHPEPTDPIKQISSGLSTALGPGAGINISDPIRQQPHFAANLSTPTGASMMQQIAPPLVFLALQAAYAIRKHFAKTGQRADPTSTVEQLFPSLETNYDELANLVNQLISSDYMDHAQKRRGDDDGDVPAVMVFDLAGNLNRGKPFCTWEYA